MLSEGQLRGQAGLDLASVDALEKAKETLQEWLGEQVKDDNGASARAFALSVLLIERQIQRIEQAARG